MAYPTTKQGGGIVDAIGSVRKYMKMLETAIDVVHYAWEKFSNLGEDEVSPPTEQYQVIEDAESRD